MNKKILFLGPLYQRNKENEIKENSLSNISNAPNVFQWNLIDGFYKLVKDNLKIINVLPVGNWKTAYKKLVLADNVWRDGEIEGREIGTLNLPFLKQFIRAHKVKKLLRKEADSNTEIIIYSAYMPFLKAAYKLPSNIKITIIITDLPEFYDLGKTSATRRLLRKLQNKMIYKYLNRVDRFVVLTKQMYEPLRIGNRPWTCVEGVCSSAKEEFDDLKGDIKPIFYSGTLHYRYGIKNLLQAFSKIEDKNVQLWICGGGEAEKEIKNLAEKDDRIKFYGFCTQAEVSELRKHAAVLVNPRTNEGEYTKYSFPSKTMEYMTSGKPIVMYKLDGIPDEYDEYLNYVDCSESSIDGLKVALESVLYDYEYACEKAIRGQTFISENKNGTAQALRIYNMIGGKPDETIDN